MKRIIWTSEVDTSDEAVAEFRETYAEIGVEFNSDDDAIRAMYDLNQDYLADEKANLDIPLDHPILVIADLGLWHGRRQGYKVIGKNVKDILSFTCGDPDEITYFADAYNVRADDTHHDGTNHYTFRVLRGDEDECWPLLDAIYKGSEVTSSLLNRYSRSVLPYVADVYGWPVAGRKH